MSNKRNIAVLMGGISPEREISLQSGNAVARAFREANNNVIEIIVNDKIVGELDEHEIDVAFIALHGFFGEDGGIQEVLESKDIPYTGSDVYASKLAMNKLKSKEIFQKDNITTLDYVAVLATQDNSEIVEKVKNLKLPVVTKPVSGGSSVGISIIREYHELQDGINKAGQFGKEVLIEKYIKGRELAVSVLNDTPLPIIEIKPASKFYDYDAKYKDERTQYIVLKSSRKSSEESLTHSIYVKAQELALSAHNSLGCCGFSRVDMIMDNDDKIYVLEVNTIPGFTERSLLPKAACAVNISFVELCNTIVYTALKPILKKKNKENNYKTIQPCYT